jgi:hypothetical protein
MGDFSMTDDYTIMVRSATTPIEGDLFYLGIPMRVDELHGETKDTTCDNVIPRFSEYIPRHIDRYKQAIEMLKSVNVVDAQVMEIGSPFPFISYPFTKTQNWFIKCVDLLIFKNHYIPNVMFTYGNLCTDDFGYNKYDIVIATECLEHLPVSTTKVVNRLIDSVKQGGYIFVSLPMESPATDPEQEFPHLSTAAYHGHIRMFDGHVVNKLFEHLTLIKKNYVSTTVYNHIQVLYRKS